VKIGIIGHRGGWHAAALQEALARRGIEAPLFDITRLTARLSLRPWLEVNGEPLEQYDALFVRLIPGGSLEQVIFRVDALRRLENAGVWVINPPAAIERTVDKYYTSTLLEDAGLPTPRTIVAERFSDAMDGFQELGGDVVVKPIFGSEGRGMTRVSDPDTAYRVFRALELGRYIYYLQEFIPHHQEDIRVFVIGGEAVAAMVRRGESWKTNVAQGAEARALTLDDELRELSTRAADALGADYAGVDILPTEDGDYTVIEINGIPGWQGLADATGINVAENLVAYVLEEVSAGT
jgi:ribosomal protein S6--L-glutamate ligase/tetrahydromethanopterin:alpha-L-glutamate ligase